MIKIKPLHLLLAALLPLAACAGRGRSTVNNDGVYKHLADKLSDGHDKLAIRKIAVLPFSYVDRHLSSDGAVISEKLITRIANEGDLEIVERSLLAKVLEELVLQHSGVFDESSIKGLGKVLGVEAIVAGTLTKQRNGSLEINARLIKTETAAILSVATGNIYPDWETSSEPTPNFAVVLPQQDPRPEPEQEPPVDIPVDNAQVAAVTGAARWWPGDGNAVEKVTGAPGVLANGTAFGPGIRQEAFSFDGTDDYLTAGRGAYYDALFDGRHPFSFSFYIKRSGKDSMQGIFSKGTDPFLTSLYINNSPYQYELTLVIKHDREKNIVSTNIGSGPAAGEWEHWAVSYDGSGRADGVRMYRKGVPLKQTLYMDTLGDESAINHSPLEFGRIGGDLGWYFDGQLDELKFFSRVLSDREVSAMAAKKYASAK